MLKTVTFNQQSNNPVVLCLGNYESLHIGHAEIISRAVQSAEKLGAEVMLMTIDEGDNARFSGAILTFKERLAMAESLKVSSCLRIDFTEEFRSLSPLQFFETLMQTLNVKVQ